MFLGREIKAPQPRRSCFEAKIVHFIQITHRDEVEAPVTDCPSRQVQKTSFSCLQERAGGRNRLSPCARVLSAAHPCSCCGTADESVTVAAATRDDEFASGRDLYSV